MFFQVLVSCVETPCMKCRARREPGYFLVPVANGTFGSRADAEADAIRCQRTTGADGAHRYDVATLRDDGWPFCPWCGLDELYSLAVPARAHAICGCYRCGRTFAEARARGDVGRPWIDAAEERAQ